MQPAKSCSSTMKMNKKQTKNFLFSLVIGKVENFSFHCWLDHFFFSNNPPPSPSVSNVTKQRLLRRENKSENVLKTPSAPSFTFHIHFVEFNSL